MSLCRSEHGSVAQNEAEMWDNGTTTKTAPGRCANTVQPRGLADWIGVDL